MSQNTFITYYNLLKSESDRGSAIIAAAILDDLLTNMLINRLFPAANKKDELFGDNYSPLANFAVKIDLAYRVGLIPIEVRRSFHLVRKVRNDFAHVGVSMDYSHSKVRDRVREIFNVYSDIFEEIIGIAATNDEPEIKGFVAELSGLPPSEQSIELIGWRRSFDLLIAAMASSVCSFNEQLPRLTNDSGASSQ